MLLPKIPPRLLEVSSLQALHSHGVLVSMNTLQPVPHQTTFHLFTHAAPLNTDEQEEKEGVCVCVCVSERDR